MSVYVSPEIEETATRLTREEWEKLRRTNGRATPVVNCFDDLEQTAVFLKYQSELLTSTAQNEVTVVEKSRRTGATWALAADAVLMSATDKSEGGMDTLYIGYNLDMAKEFIDTAADWARSFHGAILEVEEFVFVGKDEKGVDRAINAFRINFASGCEIVALTSNPRSLRGRQGFVIIDEAAFHDDFPGLLKAAMALLIWGGKVCIISTHDGDENPYNQLINDIRADRKKFGLVRFDFDDALLDGLYERVCLRRGIEWTPEGEAEWREEIVGFYGDDAEEELYCVPSKGSGAFMTGALIRARQIETPVLRWEPAEGFVHLPEEERAQAVNDWLRETVDPVLETLDPNLRHHFGNDFGRVSDLTVLWPVAVQRTMDLKTPFVVELRNVPFEQQKQIFIYILDRLPKFSSGAMDGGGNGAYLAEVIQQKYGAHCIEIVLFSQGFYRDNYPKLKADFEDATFEIPKDDDIFNDFRAIKNVRGTPQIPSDQRTVELASKNRKRHGDAAIAALLAHYASEMEVAEYSYESASLSDDMDEDGDYEGSTLYGDRTDGLY